jgi:hypothetical protein
VRASLTKSFIYLSLELDAILIFYITNQFIRENTIEMQTLIKKNLNTLFENTIILRFGSFVQSSSSSSKPKQLAMSVCFLINAPGPAMAEKNQCTIIRQPNVIKGEVNATFLELVVTFGILEKCRHFNLALNNSIPKYKACRR